MFSSCMFILYDHHTCSSYMVITYDALSSCCGSYVGCGTAVLAMAAASVFSANVTAVDIDAVAVSVAKTNVQANDLDQNIRCFEANGFGHSQINTIETFDLIFANILMAPLLSMAEDMSRHTVSGGLSLIHI